jgi:uncharacterized protein (TIGR01244 family)
MLVHHATLATLRDGSRLIGARTRRRYQSSASPIFAFSGIRTLISSATVRSLIVLVSFISVASSCTPHTPESWAPSEVVNYHRISAWLATGGTVSPEALSPLAKAGLKTIIDLRTRDEVGVLQEAAAARKAGIRYVNIPVTPATLTPESVREVAEVLDQKSNRPVLLHCSSGNRAAGVLELYLSEIQRLDQEEARRKAVAAGLKSPEMIKAVERVQRQMAAQR